MDIGQAISEREDYMIFDWNSDLGRTLAEILGEHYGHNIEIAKYGPVTDPFDISIECSDCHVLLVDVDRGLTAGD